MEYEKRLLRRELIELTITLALVWTLGPFTWKVWSVPIAFLLLVGILHHYRPDAMAWRALDREQRRAR